MLRRLAWSLSAPGGDRRARRHRAGGLPWRDLPLSLDWEKELDGRPGRPALAAEHVAKTPEGLRVDYPTLTDTVRPDGTIARLPASFRLWYPSVVVARAGCSTTAGFVVELTYGSYDLDPYDPTEASAVSSLRDRVRRDRGASSGASPAVGEREWSGEQIRLLVVEDVPQVASHMRSLLNAQTQIKMLDVVTGGDRAVASVGEYAPGRRHRRRPPPGTDERPGSRRGDPRRGAERRGDHAHGAAEPGDARTLSWRSTRS